jgi:type IV secretion system protein VirB9
MKRSWQFALCLAAGITTPAPAFAESGDERLVSRPYSADEVVRIEGRLGIQATIGFGEGEQIENVAVGDSATWQITPNKRANLLFVKPLEPAARTNMTVVTDRHTYFFDLVASPKARPLYMLRFTYPEEERLAAQKAEEERRLSLNELEQDLLSGDPAVAPVDPARLNFAWERKGDAQVMPSRIYDDGNATYLVWPAKQSIPAILIENEAGEEGPVNYSVRGDTIVVESVPPLIVLRSGKASAKLENRSPAKRTVPDSGSAAMAAQQGDPSPERN